MVGATARHPHTPPRPPPTAHDFHHASPPGPRGVKNTGVRPRFFAHRTVEHLRDTVKPDTAKHEA